MEERLPPLNWLRAFEAAARHMSFTAAATELHITQSAISQQIKSLEGYLGRPLFLRRPKSLQLTDSARAYLPTVEAAFRLLAEGTQPFFGGDHDSVLDIHANLAFCVYWLTPRLPGFLDAYPWVRLNVATSVWTTEHTRPYASVEIRFGSGAWEGITGERLTHETFYPVCTPSIADGLREPRDLLDKRLMDVSGMLESWNSWLRAENVPPPRGLTVHRASTFVITQEFARRGAAVALSHDLLAQDVIARGELKRPFEGALPLKEAYYLITPPKRSMTSAAQAFQSWLLAEMAEISRQSCSTPSRSSP